jgi:putative hemolysin
MAWLAMAVRPGVWILSASVRVIMHWGERFRPHAPSGKSESAELQELRALAALARASQLIGAREEGIIVSAARLSSRPVREGMLRAEHISMLDANSSLAEALIAGHLDLHTRFPVTEHAGDPQSIVGYANFKDIVACMRLAGHNPGLRSVVRPIPSIRDDIPLSACLEEIIREHTHIALVRDAQGRVVGMITLEDVMEELLGDIQDEYDRMPLHIKASGAAWVVGGGVSLARLADATGIDLAAGDASQGALARSLHDWVEIQLRRPVRGGDVVHHGDVCVAIRSVRRQRINEAQVTRLAAADRHGSAVS